MLVLPILVPLSTAAVLMLAPKRPAAPTVDLAGRFGPSSGQRRAGVPPCERGRRSGAANQ